MSLVFEMYWIGVVYGRFPELRADQMRRDEARRRERERRGTDQEPRLGRGQDGRIPEALAERPRRMLSIILQHLKNLVNLPDWIELTRLPVFFSSLAVSLLYITVLS